MSNVMQKFDTHENGSNLNRLLRQHRLSLKTIHHPLKLKCMSNIMESKQQKSIFVFTFFFYFFFTFWISVFNTSHNLQFV